MRYLLVLAALVLCATSCQASDSPSPSVQASITESPIVATPVEETPNATTSTGATPVAEEPTDEQHGFVELLSEAPYPEDQAISFAMLVDMERLYATAGLDHRAACEASDLETYGDVLELVSNDQTNSLLDQIKPFDTYRSGFEELPQYFGVELCEITTALSFLDDRDTMYLTVDKAMTAMAEQALSNGRQAPLLDERSTDELTVLSWQGGGSVAIRDGVVARPRYESDFDRFFDPAQERIIERPLLRGIVERLDGQGVHSLVLTDQAYLIGSAEPPPGGGQAYFDGLDAGELPPILTEEDIDALREHPGLAPWTAMGFGSAVLPDGQNVVVVVFGHERDEDARANLDRFADVVTDASSGYRAPWNERLQLTSIDADGPYLTAVLTSLDDTHPFRTARVAYQTHDTLFAIGSG